MSVKAPAAAKVKQHDYGIDGKLLEMVHSSVVLNRRARVLRDAICSVLPRGTRLEGVDIGCGKVFNRQGLKSKWSGLMCISGPRQ
jgi:hypothetical protein